MAAVVTMRVYTGPNAGTESGAQTGFALMDIDSAVNEPVANKVAPGSNSFEKWIRLRVDDPDGQALSGFWVERTGDLPDGVVIKIGTTDTPATPKATTSTVATKTMAEGVRYWFDVPSDIEEPLGYSTAGDHTRYVVLQEQVAASADDGSIETQSFEFGWSFA